MTARPLHIPLTEGLPDAGAPGQYLGRDALGAVYVLRWHASEQCWGALGFESGAARPWAHLVLLRGEQADFILGHVEGPPLQEKEPATARAGFLAAALDDVAREDMADRSADGAPLWPALAWVLGPSIAACGILVALVRLGWL